MRPLIDTTLTASVLLTTDLTSAQTTPQYRHRGVTALKLMLWEQNANVLTPTDPTIHLQ